MSVPLKKKNRIVVNKASSSCFVFISLLDERNTQSSEYAEGVLEGDVCRAFSPVVSVEWSAAETCDAELANVGNWPKVDEGDPGCDALFARGMITGRSEASTEFCSEEPTHAGGEIATAGRGGGGGKEVDVDVEEDEGVVEGPTATAAARLGGGMGEPLVGGVTSTLGGRRGLIAGGRGGGTLGICEPLGVGVEEDGRAECLSAPRTGMGGASGGFGRRVGVRMRVLREGLNEGGWLDVSRKGVGVVGVMSADEFERPDGP